MAEFEQAIPTILRHEGGYVDDPNDPGGATNFGISLRWLKTQGLLGDLNHDGDVDHNDILALTPETASNFYRVQWWDAYKYGMLTVQVLATKVFDMAVNMGASRAHKMLQNAVGTTEDGVMGPDTINEANSLSASIVVTRLQGLQACFYRNLALKNPALQKFLTGWLNRAYDRI